jgi:hypothetical protein
LFVALVLVEQWSRDDGLLLFVMTNVRAKPLYVGVNLHVLWQNAFYLPNHKSALRQQCLYRTLRTTESLSDYFQDKQKLQHYVYPEGTSDFELIEDMLEGIPQTLRPVIKASIDRFTTLEEFRRVLIDLEPGLRNTMPKRVISTIGTAPPYDRPYNRPAQTNAANARPPSPCPNCQVDHWKWDCTQQQGRTYQSQRRPPAYPPNNTPTNSNKWKPAHSNYVSPTEKKRVRFALKEEDPAPLVNINKSQDVPLHKLHQSKTPAYTDCAISKLEGKLHEVCIDSGSSISVMDSEYVKLHFPHLRVNYGSAFQIKGLGESTALGYIETDCHGGAYRLGEVQVSVRFGSVSLLFVSFRFAFRIDVSNHKHSNWCDLNLVAVANTMFYRRRCFISPLEVPLKLLYRYYNVFRSFVGRTV